MNAQLKPLVKKIDRKAVDQWWETINQWKTLDSLAYDHSDTVIKPQFVVQKLLEITKGQAYIGREYEDLVLLTRRNGTRIKLGDVAEVIDGFAETDQQARFDGEPSVFVEVFRTGDQSALLPGT